MLSGDPRVREVQCSPGVRHVARDSRVALILLAGGSLVLWAGLGTLGTRLLTDRLGVFGLVGFIVVGYSWAYAAVV